MDNQTEKLCLEEIDHLVLDADKKINLKYIANTWNVPFKDGETVLQKWLDKYSGEKEIVKEYLIRGTGKNGQAIVAIVPAKKLELAEKRCENLMRMLYSIEVASLNGKTLNLSEPSENTFITLKLKQEKRDLKVKCTPVAPVQKDPPQKQKATKNFFNAPKSNPEPKVEPKKEEVKVEKKSPTKSNDKKGEASKLSPKKNQSTKQNPGKPSSSISTFFSGKAAKESGTEKSISETVKKIEKVEIKDEPEVENLDSAGSSKNSHKRALSNGSDRNEDSIHKSGDTKSAPSSKKMKLEPKKSRSRLMQICDSSSDEEEPPKKEKPMDVDEETPVKKEKENKTPSPPKDQTNKSSSSSKRRAKVKKMVTRTYEDEDGFINTVREMEEVSCSDEEPEVVAPAPSKPEPVSNSSKAGKKKISPPAGKKQGSILSFFSKK